MALQYDTRSVVKMTDELVEIQHYEVLEDRVDLSSVHDPHDSVNCVLCQLGPKPLSVTTEEE